MARADPFPKARTPWPRQALLTAVLGALLSLAIAVGAHRFHAHRTAREFGALVESVRAGVEHELDEARWSARALRALWESSREVTDAEFASFARRLIEHDSAAIELHFYARRFDVETRGSDGRSSYVLTYAARRDGRAPTLPSDVDADPQWRELLENVVASKDAVLQRDRLAEPRSTPSVLAADAIHVVPERDPTGSGTPELAGIVLGRFDIEVLMRRALSSMPEDRLLVRLFEADTSDTLFSNGRARDDGWTQTVELEHEPLRWSLNVSPSAEWRADHRSYWPIAIALFGVATSCLLAWYIRALEQRRTSLSRANAELYTEVADRHTIEKELRETQRALATLVSNLSGIAYRCSNDRSWSMEFISDGCIPLTGWTPSDFLTSKVTFGTDIIQPEYRHYVWNAVQQAIDARKPFQLRYQIRTRSGETRWFFEQGRGVFSRAGELLAIEGLMIDISDQKKLEEQLKDEQAFTNATIESLPGTFYVFDEDGRFHRWNQNVERITGYSHEELKSMRAIDFFDPEHRPRIAAAVEQVFSEGRTHVEAPMRTKSGESIPFAFSARRFELDGERYMVGVGLDDSERESARADRALLRSHIVRTQKLETLGLMAGAVAHDFDNLLTVVFGLTGLAKRELEPGSPARELLEQALGASNNARTLTAQLLALAEIEASSPSPLDASEVIASMRSLLQASVTSRVPLEFELASNLPPVEVDPADLRQLALNLVLNAAEASEASGHSVRVSTTFRTMPTTTTEHSRIIGTPRAGDHVVVSIADAGVGMSRDVLERIGEPFFTTRRIGRGLGWAAAAEIVRSWQGWVEITSSPERGTTVDVMIPVPREPSSDDQRPPPQSSF